MTNIPELQHGEGSWVCTQVHDGHLHRLELHVKENVQALAECGWSVETIGTYLARINSEVKGAAL